MKKITFVVLCFFTLVGKAQEIERISGIISDESGNIEGVHIYNKTQNAGTVSNAKGEFIMQVFLKDTLIFSSIQHSAKSYVVQKQDIISKLIKVHLEIALNELDPVMLSTHSLTGNLSRDLQSITTYENVLPLWSAAELERMGVSGFNDKQSNVKNNALASAPGGASIDLLKLFEHVTTTFEKKKTYISTAEVTDFYSIEFIRNHIDIPQSEVYNFIDFLAEQKDIDSIIAISDKLKVLSYIMDQAEEYKKHYGIIKN
ncbi:carboxypeptidase-like regulatory domain-containing protein [Aquimarina intermedia]|uniref:Carboxypeptidase-like protein n=1 Tax=Aquimarina intermedia TaxID=350814 RepID=A0A5S5C9N3_9FLAO|nr:carboxypeptidase-like regulatory domain-containing protein [Aquimarina intermedia]TYP76115.1 hypothetical protein BD809_102330 [Aquimarina intermedia]